MSKESRVDKTYIKLIERVDAMVNILEKQPRNFRLYSQVDQFYYIQKSSELKLLLDQVTALHDRVAVLEGLMDLKYREVFGQWKSDIRLMSQRATAL